MMNSPEFAATKKVIADILATAGWVLGSEFDMAHTCLIARKDYDTAVGVRTASISLEPRSEGAMQVVGLYESEGGNALRTTWLTIPTGTTDDVIATGMAKYIVAVDKEVDGTYARGLHLRYPKEA